MRTKHLLKVTFLLIAFVGFSNLNAQNQITNGEFDEEITKTIDKADSANASPQQEWEVGDMTFATFNFGANTYGTDVSQDATGKLSGDNSLLIQFGEHSGWAKGYQLLSKGLTLPAATYNVSFIYDAEEDTDFEFWYRNADWDTLAIDTNVVLSAGKGTYTYSFTLETTKIGIVNLLFGGQDEFNAPLNANFDFYMDSLVIIDENYTDINEVTNTFSEVSIYPNPTNDVVNINLSSLTGNTSVSLIDISGRLVLEQKNVENDILIISDLESGLYFVRIRNNQDNTTYKLIVE